MTSHRTRGHLDAAEPGVEQPAALGARVPRVVDGAAGLLQRKFGRPTQTGAAQLLVQPPLLAAALNSRTRPRSGTLRGPGDPLGRGVANLAGAAVPVHAPLR